MCLKDLRDEFLYDCECRHLAKGSLRNYRAATRFLVDFLELRRITELEEVKPHHIRDLIREKQDMGSKERVVPKSPALSKQLMKYRTLRDAYLKEYPSRHKNLFLSKNGKPLTDEAVARMLKHAAKEVGVSPSVRVSPHTCRHTFAQMQLKNGLDLYSVSRLMGHVNIMITQRYLLGIKDKDIVDRGTQTSPLMNL